MKDLYKLLNGEAALGVKSLISARFGSSKTTLALVEVVMFGRKHTVRPRRSVTMKPRMAVRVVSFGAQEVLSIIRSGEGCSIHLS